MTVPRREVNHELSHELAVLFDLMEESLAIYTREARILFVNPATCQLFDKPREALVGRVLWEIFPDAVGNDFYLAFQRAAETSQPQHFEFNYPPLGRVFANSIYVADSTLYVLAHDITRERAANDRLAVLAEASRAFAHGGMELAATLDMVARSLVVSLADFCVVRLLAPGGASFESPIACADRSGELLEVLRALPVQPAADGLSGRAVMQRRALLFSEFDGSEQTSALSDHRNTADVLSPHTTMVAPLIVGAEVFGVIWVGRNATPGAYRDPDLLLLQNLADRAALTIAHVRSFERALRSEQQARESEQRKDEFLAMLGHELRNPLAPILTAAQLMRLRGTGAGFGRELAMIERQVGHVVALVDDLLDVSRITRGKIELHREQIDLGRVVMQAVEMTRPLVEHRRHGLALDVAEGLWVDGDAHRLSQVIANLLTNAARYMEPGGRISLSARATDGHVQVRVRDGGPGIAPELLPRIFDLFAQGPRSLERREGGLGLGLYIVRSIVSLHGGSVDVTTVLGQGSDFVVSLPACRPDAASGTRSATRSSLPPASRKVLVVDDNADAAALIADALRAYGCDVRTAGDASGALDVVQGFQPEVAVLDIGLPGMDGWELGRKLRDVPGLSALRLVAISGYGQSSDRERSASASFAAHLVKPVDLDGLLAVLA